MPEIPGFYFDEARNRYFKIANHSSSEPVQESRNYDLASVQAIRRRQEQHPCLIPFEKQRNPFGNRPIQKRRLTAKSSISTRNNELDICLLLRKWRLYTELDIPQVDFAYEHIFCFGRTQGQVPTHAWAILCFSNNVTPFLLQYTHERLLKTPSTPLTCLYKVKAIACCYFDNHYICVASVIKTAESLIEWNEIEAFFIENMKLTLISKALKILNDYISKNREFASAIQIRCEGSKLYIVLKLSKEIALVSFKVDRQTISSRSSNITEEEILRNFQVANYHRYRRHTSKSVSSVVKTVIAFLSECEFMILEDSILELYKIDSSSDTIVFLSSFRADNASSENLTIPYGPVEARHLFPGCIHLDRSGRDVMIRYGKSRYRVTSCTDEKLLLIIEKSISFSFNNILKIMASIDDSGRLMVYSAKSHLLHETNLTFDVQSSLGIPKVFWIPALNDNSFSSSPVLLGVLGLNNFQVFNVDKSSTFIN